LLAPLAGVRLSAVDWPLLGAVMVFSALAMTGVGFSMAWWINSSTGYHAVMSLLLIPAWVLSGAMFPIDSAGPVLGAVMRINPMRFAVEGIRRALFGSLSAIDGGGSAARDVLALLIFASVTVGISAWRVSRRE
jgi:ABC-2 type transport system permease protein